MKVVQESAYPMPNAVEAWNEKNPDKAINITYSDADTSVFLQHVADGSQDFTIIDLAMYNSYMEEFNYDVQKNDIPEDEAKMIAENSYAFLCILYFPTGSERFKRTGRQSAEGAEGRRNPD